MKKYALMMASAALIASAPAYYAFQANAEEAPKTEAAAPAEAAPAEAAAVDCANVPEGTEKPAECANSETPAAGGEAPAEKAAE